MKTRSKTPKVMTVEEVSRYLGVKRAEILKMVERAEIPAYRIGEDWKFVTDAIDLWRRQHDI